MIRSLVAEDAAGSLQPEARGEGSLADRTYPSSNSSARRPLPFTHKVPARIEMTTSPVSLGGRQELGVSQPKGT